MGPHSRPPRHRRGQPPRSHRDDCGRSHWKSECLGSTSGIFRFPAGLAGIRSTAVPAGTAGSAGTAWTKPSADFMAGSSSCTVCASPDRPARRSYSSAGTAWTASNAAASPEGQGPRAGRCAASPRPAAPFTGAARAKRKVTERRTWAAA